MSEAISTQEKTAQQPQFKINAFYLGHLSLERGMSPRALSQGVTPEMKLELRIKTHSLEKEEEEVVLDLTITTRNGSHLLYLIKIHQAGCFTLTGFTPEQKDYYLNVMCASLIYPYACHKVNTLAVDAGFPPLNLLSVDFAHLYGQRKKQETEEPTTDSPTADASDTLKSEYQEAKPANKWATLTVSAD